MIPGLMSDSIRRFLVLSELEGCYVVGRSLGGRRTRRCMVFPPPLLNPFHTIAYIITRPWILPASGFRAHERVTGTGVYHRMTTVSGAEWVRMSLPHRRIAAMSQKPYCTTQPPLHDLISFSLPTSLPLTDKALLQQSTTTWANTPQGKRHSYNSERSV
ncbi:hypothetical protein BDV95DRAFT_307743 [Massariosphaeria phaeospora]|uniref:Uncharacterized protein n=1 Tax=Massariosphaeria phaeospora TaxID=100035 RepID=A0A7C8MA41_9PLEO|nr:hypothetical protein BDV95DRAFT_307743 [Massariosphaeria phaeospora]